MERKKGNRERVRSPGNSVELIYLLSGDYNSFILKPDLNRPDTLDVLEAEIKCIWYEKNTHLWYRVTQQSEKPWDKRRVEKSHNKIVKGVVKVKAVYAVRNNSIR